ncbi:MAG: hypothetical protein ACK5O7_00255 [Holosporales bacterium]
MSLKIETFNATQGGQSLFKALGHPLAAEQFPALHADLKGAHNIALYDPHGIGEAFFALYPCVDLSIVDLYVQRYEDLHRQVRGMNPKLVTSLPESSADTLFILSFDLGRSLQAMGHLIPQNCRVVSLESLKTPQELHTNPRNYLDPLNFATNYALFRDQGGVHTRVATANYWSGYSGKPTKAWLRLFDIRGQILKSWIEELPEANQAVLFDSAEIRARFDLPEFVGQLFIHIIGAAGHDIVKYALDVYSDDGNTLTCTHDANAWPSDLYAGLPAPKEDEQVLLWVQNSHPCAIPAGGVGLNIMGHDEIRWWQQSIPPFGTALLDTKTLFPDVFWPQQFEIQAGKHFVRPRYEVVRPQKAHMAHANVERVDLKNDPVIPHLTPHFGKGFILPAPIFPLDAFRSLAMPTPMSTAQMHLPLQILIYDAAGTELLRHSLGNLKRHESLVVDASALLKDRGLSLGTGHGHMELVYDFHVGQEADGWLHGLFRYERLDGTHAAETSFGAHIFNTAITYKSEPQSYRGAPPGLSTRLFLRVSESVDSFCYLVYPVSTSWHAFSHTELQLFNNRGHQVAARTMRIPMGGSHFFRVHETFSREELAKAGLGGYVIIRDTSCRLFGYHGLIDDQGRFSLDHMFGF